MVTVTITVRNQREYVETCIESIVNQDFDRTFEIIAIDDASTDGSVDVIEQKFGSEVKIIKKASPSGWLDSLAKACKVTEKDILVFFDPHCKARPGWLRNIVGLFESNSKVSIVTGPSLHGETFMHKLSALTFHAGFLSQEKKFVDYIFDDNFAIKKSVLSELLKALPVDRNVNDGIGSVLISSKIKNNRLNVLYEPQVGVFHISLGFSEYLKEWSGFCAKTTIEARRLDPTIKGANWLKYAFLASFIYALARFTQDTVNIFRFRRELSIKLWEMPLLLLASAVGKLYYLLGMLKYTAQYV